MQKILVTGGAGYLGSVLVPQLLAAGHAVTVLDSFMFRQNSLAECCASDSFNVVRGDCRDERIIGDLLKTHDAAIPLAALVGAPLCERDRLGAVSINRDAVRLLCKLASPSQRILMPVTNKRLWHRATWRFLHGGIATQADFSLRHQQG